MTARAAISRHARSRGSTLVEFSLCAFLLMTMSLAAIEFGRMLLVYTTVANASRVGARYAIVHGDTRTGTGADGPSGPGNNPAQVVQVEKNFASAGLLDTSRLAINITYPDALNTVGSHVNISVVYPYDPFTTFLPLRVRLGSATQGIIVF